MSTPLRAPMTGNHQATKNIFQQVFSTCQTINGKHQPLQRHLWAEKPHHNEPRRHQQSFEVQYHLHVSLLLLSIHWSACFVLPTNGHIPHQMSWPLQMWSSWCYATLNWKDSQKKMHLQPKSCYGYTIRVYVEQILIMADTTIHELTKSNAEDKWNWVSSIIMSDYNVSHIHIQP